ncbi:hypothetical protein [Zavarzinia sp.]|uniref:hypothetical protein n=1 Tax=Zavarzinia sp. TaxID=2027920 RepID=UPI00356A65D7
MTYGLNSPLYPFKIAGFPINGIWTLAGVPSPAVPSPGGLEASALAPADAQSPSELVIDPPTYTDVHPTGEIYPMLQEGLRTADEQLGSAILRRLLQRPSDLWKRSQQKIWRLTLLADPARTPDALLDHLRAHVGFGAGSGKPDEIARQLSPADLRKLIRLAVPYWNRRGLRSGLQDAIRTFTGAYPAIDDFFATRWIVGDVTLGLTGEPGGDPWIVYASADPNIQRVARQDLDPPKPAFLDEPTALTAEEQVPGDMRCEIRVPLRTTALQEVVLDLIDLARPVGERWGVAFVDWIDTLQAGRKAWWKTVAGSPSTYVDPSSSTLPPQLAALSLQPGTFERVSPGGETTWTDYVWQGSLSYTATGVRPTLRFYSQDNENHYKVTFTPGGLIYLMRLIGGVTAILAGDADAPTAPAGTRGYRIDVQRNRDNTSNEIRVWWDGQELFGGPVTDNTYTAGPVEIGNAVTATAAVQYHRSEIFQRPLRYVEVGPT